MEKIFEIYWKDLTLEAQSRLLKFFNLTDTREMNWDVFPVTQVEIEEKCLGGEETE